MNFEQGEPLAKYTSFKIGGKAKFFLNAKSVEEVINGVKECKEQGTPYFILGGGSNLLVSDNGFDGLVIKMSLNKVDWLENGLAEVQSGFSLSAFAMLAGSRGLGGMEVATTIPGTIGGAIRGNAGAYGWEVKDSIVKVMAFDTDSLKRVNLEKGECMFLYRDSVFKHKNLIVLSGVFKFNEVEARESLELAKSYQNRKSSTQPMEYPNTGCIFKNVIIDEIDKEIFNKVIDISQFVESGKIPAGYIIEKLGLKGKQIGQAKISEKHGNFIINLGGATSDHVVELISYIKQQVRDRLGVELKEEIQYLGF